MLEILSSFHLVYDSGKVRGRWEKANLEACVE